MAEVVLSKIMWLGALGVVTATIYGTAALWAVSGRANWLWRLAPIVLLLAALAPLGAYELIVMYATQGVVTIGIVSCFRGYQRRKLDRDFAMIEGTAPGGGRTYGLPDLLIAVLLTGALFAILRFAAFETPSLATPEEWFGLVISGATLGTITSTAAWIVFGRSRWWYRATAFVAVVAVGTVLEELFGDVFEFLWQFLNTSLTYVWTFAGMLAYGISITSVLMVLRGADWLRMTAGARPVGPTRPPTQREKMRGVVLARLALVILGTCVAAVIAPVYSALLPPRSPIFAELPEPNGHDAVLRACRQLNWSAMPSQDADETTAPTWRLFVNANTQAFDSLHTAVQQPSCVPVEYKANFTWLPWLQDQRSMVRALDVRARLASADGRHLDAANADLDIVQLGTVMSNGGLSVHDATANAIQGVGLFGLAKELPYLDVNEFAHVCESLEAQAVAREPTAKMLERDKQFTLFAYGWFGRLFVWADISGLSSTDAVVLSRKRCDTELQLVLADAATRRYMLEHGSPPNSLDALVPAYLVQLPDDPFGNGPLVYRRTNNGYLLYSVGANGVDDGGECVSIHDTLIAKKGDFFFDAREEFPEESVPSSGGADTSDPNAESDD